MSASCPIFKAERLASPGCRLGECPVWHATEGCVYWTDIPARMLWRVDVAGERLKGWSLPVQLGAFALAEGVGFIAATDRGFARLRLDGDEAHLDYLGAPELPAGWRMNDGACDRQGRFWAGSIAAKPGLHGEAGALYSIGRNGMVSPRGGRFQVQNGLAWSPDGRRMYVSDSFPAHPHILSFDFDPESGMRGEGRLFADHQTLLGRPDGAAMDVDGCYWIAASDSGRILRMTPEGHIDAEIHVPVPNGTNLCFGGGDRKTAFITSMNRDGLGGDLFAVELPFQGLEETPYRP
ncbi:hypothetical protein BJF93_08525 [Xaviernesmea oryzae]|uniref:SMP-30/Gluconolactonase/LRE-like region domain-containing protein n=1 Tax=Xaviernesmea oryzae TaxID=464029 RepID=A0A1Q9B102_9HYPH|nr:SMP-30/gluconolactonase/LRE family protein [Xaviernesmea oryzae]OLP61640.1 hypothetical protein BJF93_08525 [Xaviernesmea oryzae]SEL05098.1 Sugar lactone lactonase YvrE [Xaviernesmea oryzae]